MSAKLQHKTANIDDNFITINNEFFPLILMMMKSKYTDKEKIDINFHYNQHSVFPQLLLI